MSVGALQEINCLKGTITGLQCDLESLQRDNGALRSALARRIGAGRGVPDVVQAGKALGLKEKGTWALRRKDRK